MPNSLSSPARRVALPYAHLNLRRNPFGEAPLSDRGRLAVVDIDRFVEPLREGGFAVQFLGDKGFGKTTHVLALREHFRDAPYLHIAEGERPRELPEGELLFLDELQRVPRRARRDLFARVRSLVIGTHRDCRAELERAGLRVESVYPSSLLDEERLLGILTRRIEWARREEGAVPGVWPETVESLIDRHGADVRAMISELYDRFLSLESVRNV